MFRYATSLPPSTFITEQWPASAAGHSSADQSRTKPPTHILAAEARIVKSIWELGKIVNFAGKVPQHYICKVNPKRIWCMARKVISEVYASFVLSLGGNVNTRRMLQPHGIHLSRKKINEIFSSEETIMWIIIIFKM